MVHYSDIPELVAQYLEETGEFPRWVTVKDIRTRFRLEREWSSTVAGFLRRIENGPFISYPFMVVKSERIRDKTRSTGVIRRYLVQKRDAVYPRSQKRVRSPPVS